jgi:hypothetical protein
MNLEEFLLKFYDNYQDKGSSKSRDVKMNRIRSAMQYGLYDLDKIYDTITSQNWYGSFPSWDLIKEIVFNNRITPKLYEDEPGKVHGVDGIWVCKMCRGKQGRMVTKIIDGIEYYYKEICSMCNDKGKVYGNNDFKYFDKNKKIDFAEIQKQANLKWSK